MAFDNRDNIDFGKTKVTHLFYTLLIPTLLGMIFNVAFVLTDGIFVGNGVGSDGLACVNLVAPIMMVITGIALMFAVGGSVVAAIHLSQNNDKAARINVTQAFVASTLVSILLAIAFYLFPHTILSLLGVSAELHDMSYEYYVWVIPSYLMLVFQIVGEFMIRLDGSPKYAMYANIIPAMLNIILDYVFIMPCGLGLMGAALATDIGCSVGALITAYYMLFKTKKLHLYKLKTTLTSLRLGFRNVGYMAKLGLSAFIGEFAISIMMLTGNLAFEHFLGDSGVAAYSVICYLFPVVYMIYAAISQSAQPIISYNYGAQQGARMRKAFSYSTLVAMIFGIIVTIAFCAFSPLIISAFLDKTDIAFDLATKGLPLYALGFVFIAFNVSVISYFQSIERATLATVLMLLRGMLLVVILFVALPRLIGNSGLWLAVPCAEVLTALVGIYFYVRRKVKF